MAERPHVVILDGRTDPSELGGKAAALDRLVAVGHPVPRSAAVTTTAYRVAARTPQLAALLERLHGGSSRPGDPLPDELTDGLIDEIVLGAPLPDDVRRAIDDLASDMSGPLAVRSSATAEDLSSSAFAGQYRTLLDVEPRDLEHAVRLVWASLWHDAPRRYRTLRHIDDRDPAMAVLVMEMIDAATAGVLFTSDPVGDAGDLRLETVAGPGEALVSGAVTPTALAWPRGDAARRAANELGPPFGDLVERALAIEATAGRPQDIEFAVDRAGTLWLLQARPITAIRRSSLTRSGIAEMLPGALPPLLMETAARHVDEGFRCLYTDLGGRLDADTVFVRSETARAMLDTDELRRATATVPGGSVAELERGYGLPSESPSGGASSSDGETTGQRATLRQTARVLRRRRDAVLEAEIVTQAIDRLAGADDLPDNLPDGPTDIDPSVLGDRALLALWERVQDLGVRATTAEVVVAALATAAYRGVERTLARHTSTDSAAALAQHVTRHRRVDGPLARHTRSLPPLPAGTDWSRLRWTDASARLEEHPDGVEFLQRWQTSLDGSGSRSVFGGPTWADEPDLAWLAFTTSPAAAHDAADLAEELSALRPPGSRIPGMSPLREHFLRREIADAAALLGRREQSKQALLDLGGLAHRLGVELGVRLARSGTITRPDDVWMMTPPEIRSAVLQRQAPAGLAERRASFERDAAATTATPAAGGDRGWGASPGSARGTAVVVELPREGAIERGDVLIARNTDASWSPLLAIAGAIVVEEGGPLSHAAILAREFGIPTVVNLPGIVDRVLEAGPGATVEVDGSAGTVAIESAADVSAINPSAVTPVPVLSPPDETHQVGVFVSGLIGASALLGAVVSITEAVSSARGVRRVRVRAAAPAAVLARTVRDGSDVARNATDGLRSRPSYGLMAALAFGLAAAILGAGIAEYATSTADVHVPGLATAGSGALALLAVAWSGVVSWRRWPDVPATVRRFTPPPRPHLTARRFWAAMPELHRRWLVALASAAAVLLTLAVHVEPQLRAVDERLYEAIGAEQGAGTLGPDWFGMYFGRPQVVIPVALLVALFTVRCRVLALAYPLTIMVGGILNMGLGAAVGRSRPPLGAHAGQTDSFPSGHAIEVTLLLGLAPLAIAVLLRSRWAGIAARVVATPVLAVMLIDGLREGSHWPSDHLAGFSIAMSAVVLVHALARTPALHRSCTRCPALALVDPSGLDPSGLDPSGLDPAGHDPAGHDSSSHEERSP